MPRAAFFLATLPAILLMAAGCVQNGSMGLADRAGQTIVPKYGLYEITLTSPAKPANPFWDAQISADFVSPSGKKVTVDGFYYGGDQWRLRFVPRELGQWRYKAVLTSSVGKQEEAGGFLCQGVNGHGSLRLSKANQFRMEYDDGTPFYPIGVQAGWFPEADFDGPNPDGSWRTVATTQWAETFDGAINLIRIQMGQGTTDGCAPPLIKAGDRKAGIPPGPVDRYDTDLAAKIDQTYLIYRRHGFSQILTLFQDMSAWGSGGGQTIFGRMNDLVNYKNVHAPNMPLQEKYIRYIVARYGCFVDIWELFNEESFAPNDYLAHLADVIRHADPYGHLITTNFARPREPWCQIDTWHEYMGMPANEVDAYLNQIIGIHKSYGKVVQNTEFGNAGILSNVDPVKWRISVWTAFMNESSLLFWNMSGRKVYPTTGSAAGGNTNAYIGPDTRRHFRVLMDFSRDMPIDMRPVTVGFHEHNDIRTYGLSNGAVTAVYVHHFADHNKEFQYKDKLFVETGPGHFRVRWIDPSDGREIKTEEVDTPQMFSKLKMPPVMIDIAARIDRAGPSTPAPMPATATSPASAPAGESR